MRNTGFIKRILVIIYDGLLLTGVVLVAYTLLFVLMSIFPKSFIESTLGIALRFSYLVIVTFTFYGWFWTHGGQTLGMRTWNLYLITPDGKFPSWTRAGLRYLLAIFSWGLVPAILYASGVQFWYMTIGIGYTWMLLTPSRLAWHDVLSNTRIVNFTHKPKQKTFG